MSDDKYRRLHPSIGRREMSDDKYSRLHQIHQLMRNCPTINVSQ